MAETVVAGMLVGEFVADHLDSSAGDISISTALITRSWRQQKESLEQLLDSTGNESAFKLTKEMQETMTGSVGIFRTSDQLEQALDKLQNLLLRSRCLGLKCRHNGANPELVAAYRCRRMLKLAICVASGALARTESRGAHYREDFPRRDDRNWLKRTIVRWPDGESTLPELSYQSIDILAMELPPGWRGYGARDHIAHEHSRKRQREVDQIRTDMSGEDRFAVQNRLMPYEHLLPERYRGRNARLGEEG